MRVFALALVSAFALAACNPSTPGASDGGVDSGGFPTTTASYRAEATLTVPASGQTVQAVQYRDGGNVRMEMPGMMTIINSTTREAFSISEMEGRRVAMRLPFDTINQTIQVFQADPATLTRLGSCSGAGENGTEWAHVDPNNGKQTTSCVTSDGILLRATSEGQTAWETTSVQRGSQSADLFLLPEGVQVMDLGNMSAIAEAMEKAKARGAGGQ
jgi:hypothetical protein